MGEVSAFGDANALEQLLQRIDIELVVINNEYTITVTRHGLISGSHFFEGTEGNRARQLNLIRPTNILVRVLIIFLYDSSFIE